MLLTMQDMLRRVAWSNNCKNNLFGEVAHYFESIAIISLNVLAIGNLMIGFGFVFLYLMEFSHSLSSFFFRCSNSESTTFLSFGKVYHYEDD